MFLALCIYSLRMKRRRKTHIISDIRIDLPTEVRDSLLALKCLDTVPRLPSSSSLQSVCVPTLTLVTTLWSNVWILRYSRELILELFFYYQPNKPKYDAITQASVQYKTIQLPRNKHYHPDGKHHISTDRSEHQMQAKYLFSVLGVN